MRAAQESFRLEAPEVLHWVDEYWDGIGLHILTVSPTFTLQQTRNSRRFAGSFLTAWTRPNWSGPVSASRPTTMR